MTTKREILEEESRKIADLIHLHLPPGTGFTLFLYDYGADGNLAYISTAEREYSIPLIREWLAHIEGRVFSAPNQKFRT